MKRSHRVFREGPPREKRRREKAPHGREKPRHQRPGSLLTADDPGQLAVAERLIEGCRRNGEPLFLPILVLCELVWVLASSYGQTKTAIIHVLEQILEMDQLQVEDDGLVRRSLEAYSRGKGNFADYLIGEIGRRAGCRDIVTFDRALKGAEGFTVIHTPAGPGA